MTLLCNQLIKLESLGYVSLIGMNDLTVLDIYIISGSK